MAETIQEIFDRLNADPTYATLRFQVGDEVREYPPEMREAMLTEWAASERKKQLEDESNATETALRQQVRGARSQLQAIHAGWGTATQAQKLAAVDDIAVILDRLIGALGKVLA